MAKKERPQKKRPDNPEPSIVGGEGEHVFEFDQANREIVRIAKRTKKSVHLFKEGEEVTVMASSLDTKKRESYYVSNEKEVEDWVYGTEIEKIEEEK